MAVVLCFISLAAASEPAAPQTLAQFHHTAWTRKDGSPGAISALAQTADGWLWLGSGIGLYRFDGVKFERLEEVDSGVRSLFASPDGGLWIGHATGGASFLKDGRLTNYGEAQGLLRVSVSSFALDRRGRMWAVASEGLFRLEGERWTRVDTGPGVTMQPISQSVLADRQGTVWVRTSDTILALPEGEATFRRVASIPSTDLQADMIESPDGGVWVSGIETGLHRLSANAATPLQLPIDRSDNFGPYRFDSEGRLWRLRLAEEIEFWAASSLTGFSGGDVPRDHDAFGKAQGLSGNGPFSFLHDREGNVWVGTRGGLDRFRRNKLHRMPQTISGAAIAAADAGGLWSSGFRDIDLARFDDGAFRPFPKVQRLLTCAYRDPQGTVWLGGMGGLLRIAGDKIDRVPLPAAWGLQDYAQAMVMDRSGTLWVSAHGSIYRLVGGAWTKWTAPPALEQRTLRVMSADASGRLWFGYGDNHVAVIEGDKVSVLSSDKGLQVGDVMAIHPHAKQVWVGGSRGVALFENGRFRSIIDSTGAPIRAVSGIVETASGELWTNGADGITHIPKRELDMLLHDPAYRPNFERFDAQDGLEGVAPQRRPLPTAINGTDGKLWFTSSSGLYWIDPTHIDRNVTPPPVLIRAIRADDKPFVVAPGMALPQRTKSLTINYTALSLSIPERVRFRYRLDGVDDAWQDAGTRRQAFYTNLGPGPYRFRVIAANDDGVWNDTGATLDFSIEPAFFQTGWFRGTGILLALATLYGLYWWRLQVTKARMADKLQERLFERERIARELHDTLLQSLIGLTLRFDAATKKLPQENAVRRLFESALEQADAVLAEGRDRVLGLRTAVDTADLAAALKEAGRDLAQNNTAQFTAVTLQAPRRLQPAVLDEVFCIAREALLNAFRHANARSIELTLSYAREGLQLSVHDDGCGIDGDVIRAGGRAGHWGLAGMVERARKIGAQLQVHSDAEDGTRIEVRVPAAFAYRDSASIASRLWPWSNRSA